MRNVKKKTSGLVKFLNILIVLTALAAGISLIRMVGELRSSFDRDRYSNLEYDLQQGDYADMIRQYYNRHYDIAPFSTAHEESYHVAGYADTAFRQRFFETVGDEARAEALQRRVDEERAGCGTLSVATEDIDRLLDEVYRDR